MRAVAAHFPSEEKLLTEANEKSPLWAPWRIEYIRQMKDGKEDGCFFCTDGSDPTLDEENFVLFRGTHAFAMLNRYPYNPGHLLVAPYRHVGDLADLTVDERNEMFELIIQGEQAIKGTMQPQGFNMGCNQGRVAGAAVDDHVHFHLVPRWNGDTNFMPILAHTDCIPQALAEAAELIKDKWPTT